MSYRGDLGATAVHQVVGNIPIVGGILNTLLGFTSVFDDYSVQIARWQNQMQRQLAVTRKFSSPKSQLRNLQRARVAAARRSGAPVFVMPRRSR